MSRPKILRRNFVKKTGQFTLAASAASASSMPSSAKTVTIGNSTETRHVDVLVAGGGFAGVMAAIGARQYDHQVVLIEPHNVLGGQGVAGGVAGFCGDTARVNRPFAELISTLSNYNLIAPYNPNSDRRPYDLEGCAFFLQELVLAKGIYPFLHAQVIDARTDLDGRVCDVLAVAPGKRILYRPKMVIDATGDCFLAHAAGLQTMHEGKNAQLPMSLYFTLWDTGGAVKPFLPQNCPSWEHDEELPMTTLHEFSSGKIEVKMKVIGFDSVDGESLSKAEMHARRQMMGLIYYLQTHGYRGKLYDRYALASVSRQIGIRGSRRIIGEHVLREEELKERTRFNDIVAVGTYHIDYHWPDRLERAGTGITTPLDPYAIPLRSLIAKGSQNLLVAGRCASADQMAMSSMRVMATCAQMGFAAGKAAVQCLDEGLPLSDVSVQKIQTALTNDGQSLNLSQYGEYLKEQRESVQNAK
ncbi:MAG: FAD-dependent oxidoreductase [Candidatus Omnitrophica bacterium]|nr:FAD-dependent oxidoreductase [Candidatus Omnitrophota bacterium]